MVLSRAIKMRIYPDDEQCHKIHVYHCDKCGFHIHRDVLGAMNICNSTEYVGDSNIRHTA